MNENIAEKAPESEEPKGGIPQGVADDVAALASEVRAMQSRAARGWKITAVVWIVLLAIITSYLYFLVYSPLSTMLKPEYIVQMGIQQVDAALASFGAPGLDSGGLPQWAADKLKGEAPGLVRDYLGPQLKDLEGRLPELRKEWTGQVREEAPQLMDDAIDTLETDLVPRVSEALVAFVDEKTDELLAQVDADVNRIVGQVVAETEGNLETLGFDMPTLRKAMDVAFEDAMGPVLDEMFEGLNTKIAQIRTDMTELVEKHRAGRATHEERLEIRLIQLVRALFERAAFEEPPGLDEILGQLLDELTGAAVPEPTQAEITRQVRAGGPVDLSAVPEEAREQVRRAVEAARKAAAAQARATEAPAAPRREAPTPEAQEAVRKAREAAAKAEEAARKAKEEATKRAPAEARPEAREAMEEAKKRAAEGAEAARKAAEEAKKAAPAAPAAPAGAPSPEARKRAEEGKRAAAKAAEAAARKAAEEAAE